MSPIHENDRYSTKLYMDHAYKKLEAAPADTARHAALFSHSLAQLLPKIYPRVPQVNKRHGIMARAQRPGRKEIIDARQRQLHFF